MKCNRLSLLIAATLMTGCLAETHYTSAPGASGRVVDALDGRPISGAFVTLILEEFGYSDKNVTKEARTSRRGTFRISKQTQWIVYEVGDPALHRMPCAPAVLRVQHPGYELFETNITMGPFGMNPVIAFKAGDICLRKVAEK